MTILIDHSPHGPRLEDGLSARELASHIRRHRHTVLEWAKDGLIPCVRRNRRVIVFHLGDVLTAMRKNNLKPGKS